MEGTKALYPHQLEDCARQVKQADPHNRNNTAQVSKIAASEHVRTKAIINWQRELPTTPQWRPQPEA